MYILIKNKNHLFKSEIRQRIDNGEIRTWQFVTEDERTRLMHIGEENQYNDVVLRFITTSFDGVECLKVAPFVKKGSSDEEKARAHFGVVLGRFAEMLNNHFVEIGSYETILT